MIRRPHVSIAVLGVVAVAFTACGGDDDSGASAEAFCELAGQSVNEEASDEEVLAEIEALAAAAPSEIADEMNELADLFADLQAIDFETASEEDMAAFEAALPEFDELSADVETWARTNCPDLPEGIFSTGS